jgi:hypothetical protein
MEGRHFGAYRIVHEIGRGGMGSVYLADRVDETFHKRVAIKIVRPGFADAEIIGRFRQEREILAALDHPAIARLIDGGNTDDGVPYFLMDYADGQPIDIWCDLYAIGVLVGAIIALAGWRITRRFGWRGLAAFVIVVSIGGPIRERLYFSTAHLAVVAPGTVPWIANTLSWVCALVLSHSIMRLIAGPARDDRLARRRWSTST